ncbi:DUF2180 family protein [Streptomyces halstedii]|uniref:DUF2180 family protein n=1 Tax=Streptomyces halstedii TaxID=1944 RepID=UPI0036BA11FE
MVNCLDCLELEDATTAAVAVCQLCGGGICRQHAHERSHMLHMPNGMGVATRPRAARRLLCGTCSASERSR